MLPKKICKTNNFRKFKSQKIFSNVFSKYFRFSKIFFIFKKIDPKIEENREGEREIEIEAEKAR